MTIYQQICFIRDERFQDLRSEKEKQFIEDVADGIDGVPLDINDEDITEYLSPRQILWLQEIWDYLIN